MPSVVSTALSGRVSVDRPREVSSRSFFPRAEMLDQTRVRGGEGGREGTGGERAVARKKLGDQATVRYCIFFIPGAM